MQRIRLAHHQMAFSVVSLVVLVVGFAVRERAFRMKDVHGVWIGDLLLASGSMGLVAIVCVATAVHLWRLRKQS